MNGYYVPAAGLEQILKSMHPYVPLFEGLETKCWEADESTFIPGRVEPLKETPHEAVGEELAQQPHLLPVQMVEHV